MSVKFWLTMIAYVGKGSRAELGSGAATKAELQQARTDSISVGNAELGTQVADAGNKSESL